jgi:fructokinase
MARIVVGLGEILWDLFPGGRKLGGAPANFACHANRLGVEGVTASSVGDDAPGRDILGSLRQMGLGEQYIQIQREYPTGTVTVRIDARGVPSYTIHEGVAWDHMAFGPGLEDLAGRADAVCVGSLAQRCEASRNTIHRFLDATRPACLRVFDVNLRQGFYSRDVIETTLRKTRVVKMNDEEWPMLARLLGIMPGFPDGLDTLRERFGLEAIALTRGPGGSVLFSRNGLHELGAVPVKVVDTVGAGDAFTAALTVGMLNGWPFPLAHEHAAKVAAYVCTQCGATPELPKELAGLC